MHIEKLIKTAKEEKIDFDFTGLQPFLIDSNVMRNVIVKDAQKEDFESDRILSTPFGLWSFELSDGLINYSEASKDLDIDLLCVVVKEVNPLDYIFLFFGKIVSNGEFILTCIDKKFDREDVWEFLMDFTSMVLGKINSQKSGLISTRIREKYKFKNKNRFYKCNNIIYISNNTEKEYINGKMTFPINWNHSWHVRGHWRRLDNLETMGRDRLGERIVKGFTWINPYLKGDGKELIKVRKVR